MLLRSYWRFLALSVNKPGASSWGPWSGTFPKSFSKQHWQLFLHLCAHPGKAYTDKRALLHHWAHTAEILDLTFYAHAVVYHFTVATHQMLLFTRRDEAVKLMKILFITGNSCKKDLQKATGVLFNRRMSSFHVRCKTTNIIRWKVVVSTLMMYLGRGAWMKTFFGPVREYSGGSTSWVPNFLACCTVKWIIFARSFRPSFWESFGVCWLLVTYLSSKRLLWCIARSSLLQTSCWSTKMQSSEVRKFFQCSRYVVKPLRNLSPKWRFLSSHEKTLPNSYYGQSMFLRCMPYTYAAQSIQMKCLIHMSYNSIFNSTHTNCNLRGGIWS